MSEDLRPYGPAASRAVPLPVAWRALRRECVIRGDDGGLYRVEVSGIGRAGHWSITLACGTWREVIEGSPDDAADVLVPGAESAAIELCREVLGASVIHLPADGPGGDEPDLIWRGDSSG
jgi:hypothetical protein